MASICLTCAAASFIPLTVFSPLLFLRGWKVLLSTWGLWGFVIGQGLCFLLDIAGGLHDWLRDMLSPRQQHSHSNLAQHTPEILSTPSLSRRQSHSEAQVRHIGHQWTLPSTLSRTSSVKFVAPSQQPSLPASRRASSTMDNDDALHIARAFRESARPDHYMYDLSLDGASRLSSRRSSRATSTVDLELPDTPMESGNATPRKARSRTGSFTFTANAFPSRNVSTSSLASVPESTRRHKWTRTGG
ncbi:hypothetical protein Slin14017_G116460 [Septoria linicola]|nr:hypothetical protein Slin14017_G116460 [Septoria linicola]